LSALDVVTGAFSYTGRHIAEHLLLQGRRVRTLTRRPPDPAHPLAGRVDVAPLAFEATLEPSLRGVDTLYNTYWVRFEHGQTTFAGAVSNTGRLLEAAARAGVRRVVHVSVSNPDERSPFAYFRGKAACEELVRRSGLSYAIVRPTLVFGPDDLLLNDIAWTLRRAPVFLVPGDGGYEVQPVSVGDAARICVEVGGAGDDTVVDAAGPDRLPFGELVRMIRDAIGSRSRIHSAPPWLALAASRVLGLLVRDVPLTREEMDALRAGLLVSHEPARGVEHFAAWLATSAPALGLTYASELGRNYRGRP
jgi:uncharacterized protein YbjT (DUF2867 family)